MCSISGLFYCKHSSGGSQRISPHKTIREIQKSRRKLAGPAIPGKSGLWHKVQRDCVSYPFCGCGPKVLHACQGLRYGVCTCRDCLWKHSRIANKKSRSLHPVGKPQLLLFSYCLPVSGRIRNLSDAPCQRLSASQISVCTSFSSIIGSRTSNTDPFPGPLLTDTVPPWSRTAFFTMASPNPVPPSCRLRDLSTR